MKTLKQYSIKIDFEFNLNFWALTPAFNLNFSSSTFVFEFEWLCIGIYASKVKHEPVKDGGKVFADDFFVSSSTSRNKNNRFYEMKHKCPTSDFNSTEFEGVLGTTKH